MSAPRASMHPVERAHGVRRVGLVVHGGRREAVLAAREAADALRAQRVEVVGARGDAWGDGVALRDPARFAEELDLVVVLGGDGTFLRAAYLVRDHRVPLLGVNLGRLGFLADLEHTDLPSALPELAAGRFAVEERMTLTVEVADADDRVVGSGWALNDASVRRTSPDRLVHLEVRVSERPFSTVPADAMIVATPTGSTAYAFSAGGPIVSPLVDAFLLTPVAPHSLFDRTLVVDPAELVAIRPLEEAHSCAVSLDGRESITVPAGGVVRIARGEEPVRMARLERFDFYARVRHKFNL